MATREDVLKWNKEHGDPLSGGVIIQDDQGKEIGRTAYSTETEKALKNNRTLYKVNDKEWSTTPTASVTLNKETGDIDIKAPKYVLETESFKKGLAENGVLRQLSAAYKRDKNYKFPDPLDETKNITIEEMVGRWNDYAQRYVKLSESRQNIRDDVTNLTGNKALADAFTENDFILMGNTATREEDNDKSLISVPKTLQGEFYKNLRALEGYNTANGVITKGDLREGVYNIGKSEREDLVNAFTEASTKLAEISAKKEITAEDAEEYARLTAFITYLQKEGPEAGFWEQLGVNIQGTAGGLLAAAHNVGGNLLVVGEGAVNVLHWLTSPQLWGKDWSEWASTYQREMYEQDKASDAQLQAELSMINSSAAALMQISEMAGTIGGTLAVGKITSDAIMRLGSAAATTLSINKTLNSLASSGMDMSWAQPANMIGTWGGAHTSWALQAQQSITALAGGIPSANSLVNTAQTILNLSKLNPSQLSVSVSGLLNLLGSSARTKEAVDIVNSAVKTVNMVNKAASAGTIVSQIIVDTLITDGQLMRQAIESNDPEAAGELMQAVVFDGFMYAAGFGAGAILNRLPSSSIGRAANARAAQAEARLTVAASNAKEGLKSLVLRDANYVSQIKNAAKRQVGEASALIRQATSNVAGAGKGLSGTEKTLAIEDSLVGLAAVQNAEDMRIAGVKSVQNRMFNPVLSPVLAPAYTEAVAIEQGIMALEKQYGLDVKTNYPKTLTGKQIGWITTPSANYVNRYYRLGQIDVYYDANKSYKPGMKEEKEFNEAYVTDFKNKYPKLADYLENKALPAYIKLNEGMNDFKSKHQVLDKQRLEGQLSSPLFKNGYIHTERLQDLNSIENSRVEVRVLERKNATVDDPDSYGWGSTADYVSPLAAFLNQSMEVASVINAREQFENYVRGNVVERKLLLSGEEVKRAEEIKKLKGDFHKTVIQEFKSTKESFVQKDLGTKLGELVISKSDYLNKRADVLKTGRKIARTKGQELKLTGVNRQEAFDSLSSTQVNDYAVKNFGFSFTNILPEDYDLFVNPVDGVKGDKTIAALRKEVRSSIAANANFIAGAYGLGSVEGANTLLKSLPKIKTSSYKKLMGIKTLKDADPTIKPYLSESGLDIESGDWGQWMQQYQGDYEGGGSFSGTADDVVNFYTRVINEASAEKELYKPTYDNFVQACNFDPELPTRLDQIALKGNGFLDSKEITDLATDLKRSATLEELENVYQADLDALAKITGMGKTQRFELVSGIEDILSEYIYSHIMKDQASSAVVNDLIANAQNKDAATEYVVLSELYNSAEAFGGAISNGVEAVVKREINNYNTTLDKDKRIDYRDAYDKFKEVFDDVLYDRRNRAMHILQEEGSPLVDQEGIYAEAEKLIKDIKGAKAEIGKTVIAKTNLEGLTEYYQVNPFVADLYTYRPTSQGKSWYEQMLSSQAFNLTNRVFRLASTGVNPRSIVNQTFKDSINAFAVGGAVRPAFMTEEMIAKNFGDDIAAHFEATNRELYDQIKAQAKEAGRTVGEQATRYAGASLESEISASTETQVYRSATNNKAFEVMKSAGQKVVEGFEKVNDFREVGLRKAVAMEAFYNAMKKGYTYDDAMRMASRAMRDATTDFLRQTYHLQVLTNTTPYLRSAINGTKSFWRAMSLDPVGIMLRLGAGVILPTIAATVAILTDEESREYYKTLYEREKQGSLIYKVNGKFMSIPLPEEVAAMVAPWRHLVETMFDGNRHSFWELAINDLVSMFPYDMTGFQDIDGIALSGDPTFFDRIKSWGMGLLADVLPPIGKTAFELTYGVDPYTGKKIDKSHTYLDENYDLQVMDSTQSEFAKWIGNTTGWSPSVVSAVVSNFIGTTGRDVLDSIVSMAQWVGSGGQEGSPVKLVERTISNATSPLSVTEYDRTKSAWNNTINELYAEKASMMETYNKYTDEINKADSAEKRQQIIAKRNDYIKPFIDKVRNTVTNLQQNLGGSFDTYRFSMVVSLMNFNIAGASGSGTNSASRALANEAGFDGKEDARLTIERMNIAASPDTESLLGYMYKDNNGEIQVKYYTPLEIQNAQSIYYTSKDIHYTNISNLIVESGLKDQYYDASQAVYENTNTADKDRARVEWNNKVFKTLLPYFREYGVENIMDNQEIVSYLEKYIMVPTSYKKNGRKSTYHEKLDSNLGFVKQYTIDAITEILK